MDPIIRKMDPTTRFFEELNHRGPNPLLTKVRGTVRFELEQDNEVDTWLLVYSAGNVSATQADRQADCTVRTDREFFHQIACGEANPLAAFLRNRVTVEGDVLLFSYLHRLVPGPPGAHEPRDWVKRQGRRQ
ncbi:SCP2 sterol-binding domain-containing protein [Plantactinospora sp. B5E13]|uniref:SCP2 sterol-binding domain-containing protein n=1 Tax=unclassified Plantactinospora TaxID=2631981 RepID=UPI00325C3BD0